MRKLFYFFTKVMLLSFLSLGGFLPLSAQLDPKLQVTPTDFIDLYQGVTATGVLKPEVVLVMDFSTSTNRMMFHPQFPNNDDDEDRTDTNSSYYDIYVTIVSGVPSAGHYAIQQVGFGQGSLNTSVKASNTTYTIGGNHTVVGSTATNTLIKPDGTEVTEADVIATTSNANIYRSNNATPQSYALNWVRCASHVRMRCVVGGVTRDVDFPINWAVLDSGATGKPLTPTKVVNPTSHGGDGLSYDIDSVYLNTGNGPQYSALRELASQYQAECGAKVSNVYLYRSRYIEWILWGKDTGGHYYIPDAISAKSCVDPITYTISANYDPATGLYTYHYANATMTAFANGLPNRSRSQAIKEAFLKTWFNHQDEVSFAWRTLHDSGSGSTGSITTPWALDSSQLTVLSSSSSATWTTLAAATPSSGEGTPLVPAQFDTYCQLTNPSLFAAQEAGLTKAQLDCQQSFVILLTDGQPNTNPPNEGAGSFPYISSTAGQSQSYSAGNTAVKAHTTYLNNSNSPDTYWNDVTLAAVAAHGGEGTSATWIRDPSSFSYSYGTSQLPSVWEPFWIQIRKIGGTGGTNYTLGTFTNSKATPHPIHTMTVGVSLSSSYTKADGVTPWPTTQMIDSTAKVVPIQQDTGAGKFRLLMTALCGDPGNDNPVASTALPYYINSAGVRGTNATFFFDGRDPGTLVNDLDYAFNEIGNTSAVNSTAAPVVPFVGMGLGEQVYIARFIPSAVSTNPVWTGDLAMYSTQQTGNSLQILDSSGNPITDLSNPAATPNWSADDAMRANRKWSARQVYTRLPNGTSLVRFTPFDDGTGGAPTNAYSTIKASVATSLATDAAKQQLIAWNLGADISNAAFYTTYPTINPSCQNRQLPIDPNTNLPVRPGDLFGDAINSTPASVEYTLTPWIQQQLSPKLVAQINAATAITATPHFRVIFVGTNRGFMHAFGEVSYTQTTTDPTTHVVTTLTKGDVDELWAYMPTEFLAELDTIGPSYSGKHRYTVDGSPYVWFLDLPPANAIVGNGKIDYDNTSSANSEKAMLVFGERKGGRSYYGLNIQNPFTPSLGWALVPDEAASLTASNFDADSAVGASGAALTTLKSVVQNMGFSSCIPAVGRVALGSSPKVRDALFLGGGYSTPEVEAKFTGTPALGRSAIALDVQTGKIFAPWDFSALGMGPVSAGLVPFEFFLNSGFVQRAYFTDYKGGLWALGSGYTNPSGQYQYFRRDSNALDQWTVDGSRGSALNVRKVYQDSGNVWRSAAGHNNAIYSMRPAPFLIGNYPGVATWNYAGNAVTTNPAAVGIAIESGDRDNPLDKNYTTTTIPSQHRLSVVFDRQDSARSGIGLTAGVVTDNNLSNFTAQTTAPATTYWNDNGSSTKFGYYINYPPSYVATDGSTYIPKGIYEPIVLDRVLFSSYFSPSSCTCSGGGGTTYTLRICDVLFPAWPGYTNNIPNAASTAPGCQSGEVASWYGVASPLAVMSTAAALQSGIQNFAPSGQSAIYGIGVDIFQGQLHELYPKVRTWRTVR